MVAKLMIKIIQTKKNAGVVFIAYQFVDSEFLAHNPMPTKKKIGTKKAPNLGASEN